jgi:hypothetical protein
MARPIANKKYLDFMDRHACRRCLQFAAISRNGFDLKNVLLKKFIRAGVPDYEQRGHMRKAGALLA